ncbi:MAG TPA: GNAT family N-acetyltransferase [Gaiellales bacterium]|nr:GNAT family N-acetyltransferase [Gaiellales bacterium]
MSFEFRTVEPDERAAWVRTATAGFQHHRTEEEVAWVAEGLARSVCRGAFEDGTMVATTEEYVTGLMLPGGVDVPTVAVTGVATVPSHRRRGAMRGLMERILADARTAGIDRVALWVADFRMYGRYGFASAAPDYAQIEVDTAQGEFARPFTDPGGMRLVEPDEARRLLPGIYERARQGRPGDVLRHPDNWRYVLADKELAKKFVVIHADAEGNDDGYAVYEYQDKWEREVPLSVADCDDLVWCNGDAHAALWRFLLDLDHLKTVRVWMRPLDDPIWWLLANPRRARFALHDGLWIAVLDVPRALAARRYASDGRLVLDVEGDRFLLESDGGEAACASTDREPDLSLDRLTLAACHLGGHRFSTLAQAGLVRPLTGEALTRADRLFMAECAPWCIGEF